MNDLFIVSGIWMIAGAVWIYYSDKRAYQEGMVDGIVRHNNGTLTYTTWEDEEGVTMIEMEFAPDEK